MRFESVATNKAEGAILAHSLKAEGLRFKKGRILDRDDVAALSGAGVESVIAAVLDPGDVPEDVAAERLGAAMERAGFTVSPATTGRVNLFAAHTGLFRAERAIIDRLNRIDPAITFACLADRTTVDAGAMVATIKIIPLAVSGAALGEAERMVAGPGIVAVRPFRAMRTGLVATCLPTLKASVMDKTADLLRGRLARSGSELTGETRVEHDMTAVRDALAGSVRESDLVILFGASAVTDPEDVIPAAIRAAGGTVSQVGMPVDPGNLLVLGQVGDVPVIGAPGCARSPKENGFDWILARILAGEMPTHEDITGMGVGGLLMEIPSRPQPRAAAPKTKPAVETVLLAAGRASRMGAGHGHKLLAAFDGEPLVRRMARTALASKGGAVHVVVGYREKAIRDALAGLDVDIVANPRFMDGMAGSLNVGLSRVSPEASGMLVLLADMPELAARHLDALVGAFVGKDGQAVVRAAHDGQRGNPVVVPRAAFKAIAGLSGDMGARAVVESGEFEVVDVEIGNAAHVDVDTPEAVAAAGGKLEQPEQPEQALAITMNLWQR